MALVQEAAVRFLPRCEIAGRLWAIWVAAGAQRRGLRSAGLRLSRDLWWAKNPSELVSGGRA